MGFKIFNTKVSLKKCCLNKDMNNCIFCRFPKNKQLRLQWAKFVKKSNWIPTDYSVLCSDHFSIDSFDQTSATKVLWPTAIPTIEVITLLCVSFYIFLRYC